MGPPENLTRHREKKQARARKRPVRRPRARQCLLKGCERRFHPEHVRQQYCSSECREAARKWSEWKARRKYRATAAGKRKRNGQSQRYRKRVQERKALQKEAIPVAARVITKKFFLESVATGRAATSASCARGDRRGSGSARMRASAR